MRGAMRPLTALGALLWLVPSAAAQDYPARSVRLVIPLPAGGGNDVIGRVVAAELGTRLGKQVIVDNRPGAGSIVGTEHVANAPPDGYTLLQISAANAINPFVYKLKYDLVRSFAPIALIGSAPALVVVHPSVPARSVQDLVALAKAKPGQLNLAVGGAGGFQHTAAALFASAAGIDIVLVPFKGGGPALINLLGGDSQLMVGPLAQFRAHIGSGKLRVLGIAAEKRAGYLPEVPSMAEQGVPGFVAAQWWGFVAPAGTPKAAIDRLNAEMIVVQGLPQVAKQLEAEGAEAVRTSPAEFAAFIEAELSKWGPVVKAAGIKAE